MMVLVNDLKVNYFRGGEGPSLLFLHGWGGTSWNFKAVLDAYVTKFTLLIPDLPGFGLSDAPPKDWGVGDYARFTLDFLDVLGIKRAAVLGHSFGGRIAIAIAAGWPDRVEKLVLVNSAGIRPRRTAKYYVRVGAAKLLKRMGPVGAHLRARMGSEEYRRAGPLRGTFVRVVNEDLTPLLSRIEAPTLVLWGDRDNVIPRVHMETMAKTVRRGRLVVLQGAGHFPFLEAPVGFNDAVMGFLQE